MKYTIPAFEGTKENNEYLRISGLRTEIGTRCLPDGDPSHSTANFYPVINILMY